MMTDKEILALKAVLYLAATTSEIKRYGSYFVNFRDKDKRKEIEFDEAIKIVAGMINGAKKENKPQTVDTPKCSFGDGVRILPDGVHELDPCLYEEIERYRNVTVIVSRCRKCGNVDISWERQEDTEEVNSGD